MPPRGYGGFNLHIQIGFRGRRITVASRRLQDVQGLQHFDAALLEAKRLGKCRAVHFRQLS